MTKDLSALSQTPLSGTLPHKPCHHLSMQTQIQLLQTHFLLPGPWLFYVSWAPRGFTERRVYCNLLQSLGCSWQGSMAEVMLCPFWARSLQELAASTCVAWATMSEVWHPFWRVPRRRKGAQSLVSHPLLPRCQESEWSHLGSSRPCYNLNTTRSMPQGITQLSHFEFLIHEVVK